MDFRPFSPLASILRQERREDDQLDKLAEQYVLGLALLSRPSVDNVVAKDRRESTFRMRNGFQDFDGPSPRAWRLPSEEGPARNLDRMSARGRFINSLASMDGRGAFYGIQPDRFPVRSRLIKTRDDPMATVPSVTPRRWALSTGDSDLLPSLDLMDRYYRVASPARQTRLEAWQTDPQSPRRGSNSYQDIDVQERQLSSTDRCQSSALQGCRDWQIGLRAQKERARPFGKAMKELYVELEKVWRIYTQFYEDFRSEIGSISYVSAEISKQLWIQKVVGKRFLTQGNWEQVDDAAEKWEDCLVEQNTSLYGVMEEAMHASPWLGGKKLPKTTTLEARKRLQQKVETASAQMLILFTSALKERDQCKALIDELKSLMDLVDPEKKENKSLYGADGDGNFGGTEVNGCSNTSHGNKYSGGHQDNRGLNEPHSQW